MDLVKQSFFNSAHKDLFHKHIVDDRKILKNPGVSNPIEVNGKPINDYVFRKDPYVICRTEPEEIKSVSPNYCLFRPKNKFKKINQTIKEYKHLSEIKRHKSWAKSDFKNITGINYEVKSPQ